VIFDDFHLSLVIFDDFGGGDSEWMILGVQGGFCHV